MSRLALAAASLLTVLVACSSSTDGEDCAPVGTYSMTGTIESTTCKLPPSNSGPATVQISQAPSELRAEADFVWSFSGAVGKCPLKRTAPGSCKLEGRCPITITDALHADDNQGQLLVSWTFGENGFEGTSNFLSPPFTDNPSGCTQTAKNTATRR